MNILFAGVECFPFIKVGGLGDVLGSLPKELNSLGVETRVIIPKLKVINEELIKDLEFVNSFYVFLGTKANKVALYKEVYNGVTIYFLESDKYFLRDRVYGYDDELERWALFQLGVIESLKYMPDFKVDILNCHDSHTGMIPELIKVKYFREFGSIKTVFTIHNITSQGEFDRQNAKIFNLQFDNIMNQNGKMNFMKSGILSADYVNTVSETYSKELILSEFYSMGLSDSFNQRFKKQAFGGILNGIDYEHFNPSNDQYLKFKYDYSNYQEGKKKAKEELYNKLGVDFFSDVTLIGAVSKLTNQKGFDLVLEIIEHLLHDDDFKMVLIGEGDKVYEEFFKDLEKRHPYKFKCYLGYSEEIAHLLYAASDIYLMPSKFEPCGLGQMIALKYGSIPIVRETGGLKDSIEEYDETLNKGNGFRFTKYNSHELEEAILKALSFKGNDEEWNKIVYNAMSSDYSFKASAIKYLKLYKKLLNK